MNLRATLDQGRALSDVARRAPAGPPPAVPPGDLGQRLLKGLAWLRDHYDFATAADGDKWEAARQRWCDLAAEYDAANGHPLNYTRDELLLMLAWLRGDEASPLVYFNATDYTGGPVSLAPGGGFSLPRTLRLPDGATIVCKATRAPGDDVQTTWDALDLLWLFRTKRAFPEAVALGKPPANPPVPGLTGRRAWRNE